MDSIFIENFEQNAAHGCYDHERVTPQRFLISAWVCFDTKKSAHTDNLGDTFNYEKLRATIIQVFSGEPKHLIESLAEHIAFDTLQHVGVHSVSVQITKPDIWGDCIPGIKITRTN
jgi:7,8-dihydroneopterin aldolase/epimerase/oxygenase